MEHNRFIHKTVQVHETHGGESMCVPEEQNYEQVKPNGKKKYEHWYAHCPKIHSATQNMRSPDLRLDEPP